MKQEKQLFRIYAFSTSGLFGGLVQWFPNCEPRPTMTANGSMPKDTAYLKPTIFDTIGMHLHLDF